MKERDDRSSNPSYRPSDEVFRLSLRSVPQFTNVSTIRSWLLTSRTEANWMFDFTLEDALIRFDGQYTKGPGRDDCWAWHGRLNRAGYGKFYSTAGPSTALAHRWHWFVRVGPLGPELVLDHICRNRACVRLDHLRPVTLRVNTLAGEGPSARNARKVVCSKGHVLEVMPRPLRLCPTCRRNTLRRAQRRHREATARAEQELFDAEWSRLPNLGGYRGGGPDDDLSVSSRGPAF